MSSDLFHFGECGMREKEERMTARYTFKVVRNPMNPFHAHMAIKGSERAFFLFSGGLILGQEREHDECA